jgi:hypothetical protein
MPRKYRLAKVRVVRQLSDFDVSDQLHWLASWFPPRYDFDRERARWLTWRACLEDYESVRDEFLAHWLSRPDGRPIFMERVRRFVERYGLEELETITCYEYLLAALEDDEDDDRDDSPGAA